MKQVLFASLAALMLSPTALGQEDWVYIECDFETVRSQWTEGASPAVSPGGTQSEVFRFNARSFERYVPHTGGWNDLCRPDETWRETRCEVTELQINTNRLTIQERRNSSGWGDEFQVSIYRETGNASIYEGTTRSYSHDLRYGPGVCRPTEDPRLSINRRF